MCGFTVLVESDNDHENSMEDSNVADRQNIDEVDDDSLYHKPSSCVSESNTLAPLTSSTTLTALGNTAEENCGSVLVNNNSTPSRRQQIIIYIRKALIPMTWLYTIFLDVGYEKPNQRSWEWKLFSLSQGGSKGWGNPIP